MVNFETETIARIFDSESEGHNQQPQGQGQGSKSANRERLIPKNCDRSVEIRSPTIKEKKITMSDSKLLVKCFFEQSSSTCQYVVADTSTKKAALIDSVLFFDASSGQTSPAPCDELLAFCAENGFTVQWILDTHAHAGECLSSLVRRSRVAICL